MTVLQLAALVAAVTLILPGAVAATWMIRPPFGRTRRGPALVLAATLCGLVGQALTFAGAYEAAGVVRLFGTIAFALLCLELLNRAPRARDH